MLAGEKALLAWRHVLGEPLDGAIHYVAAMGRIDKAVAFIGVNDELRGHVLIAKRMPELVGLRRGTFAVTVADHHQRGSVGLLDEVDG